MAMVRRWQHHVREVALEASRLPESARDIFEQDQQVG